MATIEARELNRHFGLRPIIRGFSHVFGEGSATAITGPNGSGKSTLLRLLCGQLLPSSGEVIITRGGRRQPAGWIQRRVNLYGPYVELIEELSGEELLNLHAALRGWERSLCSDDLWARVGWKRRIRKQSVASYSSGMKQRLRLLLALGTRADVVVLDEPTSNLDAEGVTWYQNLVQDWLGERTLLIASNEERDFVACRERISSAAWT